MYKLSENLIEKSYKNIKDLGNKRVIIRSCLNIAQNPDGTMSESTRYDEALPLIKEMSANAKQTVIMGHLGRPVGVDNTFSFEKNIAFALKKDLADINLVFAKNLEEAEEILAKGERVTVLLENIRFFSGEESKDEASRMEFAKRLSNMADIFINDAFPDYKIASSTYDIAKILPSYLGPVFFKEVQSLGRFNSPARDFVAVLGGAKLSEKLDALNALGEIADKIIVGGAMAYTLMKAKGIEIGNSRYEEDKIEVAKQIVDKFGEKLVLPVDHIVVGEFAEPKGNVYLVENENIKSENARHLKDNSNLDSEKVIAVDIGPRTIKLFSEIISNAGSILWNGPMGVFEWEDTSIGSESIGKAIIANNSAFKLAGGGDSIACINKFSLAGFDHISTGGGAMLAFLAYSKFDTLDIL